MPDQVPLLGLPPDPVSVAASLPPVVDDPARTLRPPRVCLSSIEFTGICAELGITTEDLQRTLEVSEKDVSWWNNGRHALSVSCLTMLARRLRLRLAVNKAPADAPYVTPESVQCRLEHLERENTELRRRVGAAEENARAANTRAFSLSEQLAQVKQAQPPMVVPAPGAAEVAKAERLALVSAVVADTVLALEDTRSALQSTAEALKQDFVSCATSIIAMDVLRKHVYKHMP